MIVRCVTDWKPQSARPARSPEVTSRRKFERWTKGRDKSPVSEADIAVNDFLRERWALAAGQRLAVGGNRGRSRRARSARVWVVDPIDGTRAFIEGRADWTISVALLQDGRPALAALYAPVTERDVSRPRGARRNPQRRADPSERRRRARRCESRGSEAHAGAARRAQPTILPQPKVHSLALRLARVARASSTPRLRRRQPRLGPCRSGPFGARSRRRADRRSGRPLSFNRAQIATDRWSRPVALGKTHCSRSCATARPNSCKAGSSTKDGSDDGRDQPQKQLPHLVFGGELIDLDSTEFKDLDKVDIVGHLSELRQPPMQPGRPRRSRPSTMRICAISSSTCIACSTRTRRTGER